MRNANVKLVIALIAVILVVGLIGLLAGNSKSFTVAHHHSHGRADHPLRRQFHAG